MNISLISSNKNWFWVLRNGASEFVKSRFFESYPLAVRSAETFRMSRIVAVVAGETESPAGGNSTAGSDTLEFLIARKGDEWEIGINPGDEFEFIAQTRFDSARDALNFSTGLIQEIYLSAEITDHQGLAVHPLQLTRKYRERFGIVCSHPSVSR